MSEYIKQADAWAAKYGVRMTATFTGHRRHFPGDDDTRDVYSITLQRIPVGQENYNEPTVVYASMTFDFGQSIFDSGYDDRLSQGKAWQQLLREADRAGAKRRDAYKKLRKRTAPILYSVVACIQKHYPGSFENFCGDFGYDPDSRKALDIYIALQKEYNDFVRLCGGDNEMLREAQDIQ